MTAATTPTSDFVGIYCSAPLGGHTISSNYFGGRSASCGGSALTLNSSDYGYWPIFFSSAVTGSSVTINSNVIKNINITSTGDEVFGGIDLDGSCNYSVGSSTATANTFGDTLSGTGNIVITSNSLYATNYIFYGITMRGSGTNSIKYNKFGSISIGGTATNTCYNILTSIKSTAGVTTVDNNTYGNSTAANISSTGSVHTLIAIYSSSNSDAIISNNIIRNFSQTGTGTPSLTNLDVSVIETQGTGTYTISGNRIGSTTSNNMVFATNLGVHGIHVSSCDLVSSNNIVQGFNCTGTGTGAYFHGICHSGSTGTASMTLDSVKNINMAGTISGSTTNHTGFNVVPSTDGHVITKCGVYNMAHSSTTADIILTGIWTAQSTGDGTISKCHVSGLTTASTHASATISGIRVGNSGGTEAWTVSNNVVLLNSGSTSPELNGIKNGAWTGAYKIYHNTIKIYGTATSGSSHSSAINSNITSGSTYKNNICQNLRVNGGTATGSHFAIRASAAGTFDYNYLETSASPIARYNGSATSLISDWRTASGASSKEITYSGSGISIEMVKGYTSNTQIVNKGLYFASVTDDKEGISRTNPGPWMEAFEKKPSYLPIELISFEAICNDEKTDLVWITASETNNDYFTIEYSLDAINFTTLDKVKGAGNCSGKKYYYYSDFYSPKNRLVYYRITQTDFNKQAKSFNLISREACNKTLSDFDLILYYKPLQTELNYQFNLKKEGQITIELWNLAGQVLYSQTLAGVKGDNHYSLDMSKFSKSMYLFRISDGQSNKSEKIIIE